MNTIVMLDVSELFEEVREEIEKLAVADGPQTDLAEEIFHLGYTNLFEWWYADVFFDVAAQPIDTDVFNPPSFMLREELRTLLAAFEPWVFRQYTFYRQAMCGQPCRIKYLRAYRELEITIPGDRR